MRTSSPAELWDEIVASAARESALWAEAALPAAEREPRPVFSALAEPQFALGLETIYEGYLAHYGRPRLFAARDADSALLLGDYLYAHGLVRVAQLGEVAAIADLADLISLCAQLRADGGAGDGEAWAATAALLGRGELGDARAALRDAGDAGPLLALAEAAGGPDAVGRALAAHRLRLR
ncbi:MAG TPA: hypothetical protein VM290_08500 [Gaiellaceae bacterium]|nr:hypothetical protein [Gaiellaceae bacterium]